MNKLLGALYDLCAYAIERSALIRDHPPNPRSSAFYSFHRGTENVATDRGRHRR